MEWWRLGQTDREGKEGTGKDKLRRNKALKKTAVCVIVGILLGLQVALRRMTIQARQRHMFRLN
jgi:hypothetical protein